MQPAIPLTIKIDVTANDIVLSANGQILGTATKDPAYTTSTAVGLVVDGAPISTQATATFSDFIYTPNI